MLQHLQYPNGQDVLDGDYVTDGERHFIVDGIDLDYAEVALLTNEGSLVYRSSQQLELIERW